MQTRVVGEPAKQLRNFRIAAGVHRIGQLIEPQRRLLLDLHGVGKELFDRFHGPLRSARQSKQ